MALAVDPKETIVRAFPPRLLRAARIALPALERVSRSTAARTAVRAWRTPAPPPDGAARSRVPSGSVTTVRAGQARVVAESWGGTGPVVQLVHGWGGFATQFDGLVEPLRDAGCRVVRVDGPAHGRARRSGLVPPATSLPEFAAGMAAVSDQVAPADAVVAHSLGASAAILAVLDGMPLRALVLIAPPTLRPLRHMQTFADVVGLGEETATEMVRRVEILVGRPEADFHLGERLAARVADGERLPDLLVVHDDADREIGYENGVAVAQAWPGATLITTSGLGHRRILRDAGVARSVTDYLASRLGPAA